MKNAASSLTFVALAPFLHAGLPAQAKLPAKAFVPTDHRNVMFCDLAALRERGVWEELEASVLKLAFRAAEKESGFRLRDLDRVTMVMTTGEGDAADPRRDRRVVVCEGNKPLAVPARVAQNWEEETIGGQAVRRGPTELFVQPRPELQITGTDELVRPVLEGKPHTGQPCPDILSLLSARADRLVYYVFDVANPLLQREVLGNLFPGVTWPEGDAPTFLCVQVLAVGDADDPHLALEATVRHAASGAGLAATKAGAKAVLDGWRKDPKLQSLRRVLQGVQMREDRGDLIVSGDCGRVRDAVGQFAMLMLPMLTARELEVEQAATPAPVPAPADPKK
jgi:hypothetical protein